MWLNVAAEFLFIFFSYSSLSLSVAPVKPNRTQVAMAAFARHLFRVCHFAVIVLDSLIDQPFKHLHFYLCRPHWRSSQAAVLIVTYSEWRRDCV